MSKTQFRTDITILHSRVGSSFLPDASPIFISYQSLSAPPSELRAKTDASDNFSTRTFIFSHKRQKEERKVNGTTPFLRDARDNKKIAWQIGVGMESRLLLAVRACAPLI